MAEDLKLQVLRWLHETGYPLELRVGRYFQATDWHVNYGRWYRDPISDKSRELDIQAVVAAIHPREASVFFSLCIECKTSRAKPWVALSSDQNLGEDGLTRIAMGKLSQMTLVAAKSEHVSLPTLLAADTLCVGGITQAFGGNDEKGPSPPYSALLQARSAAIALDLEHYATARDISPNMATAAVFVPLVVLDGVLLRFTIGKDLSESLEEVDAVVASVPGDAEHDDALIPVVTERFAAGLTADFKRQAHQFCVAMLPHASTISGGLGIRELGDNI